MSIQECYETFGGDYEGVIERLLSSERVAKYCHKFVDADDFSAIKKAMEAGDYEDCFRVVHNLKGVALNLGLTPLYETLDELCEALRPSKPAASKDKLDVLASEVGKRYDVIVSTLALLD